MSNKQEWPDVLLWACPICGETKLADLTIERHTAFICGGQWIRVNGEWVSERTGCERAMPVVASLRAQLQAAEEQRDALLAAAKLLTEPFVPWQLSKGAKIYGVLQEHHTTLALDYSEIHTAMQAAIALCDKAAE
jgi:hypothetical protein